MGEGGWTHRKEGPGGSEGGGGGWGVGRRPGEGGGGAKWEDLPEGRGREYERRGKVGRE